MREPLTVPEFADLTGCPADDIERFRTAGLLDLDGDGLFDPYDMLRLQFVLTYTGEGGSVDTFRDDVAASGSDLVVELFGDQGPAYSAEEAAELSGLTPEQLIALGSAMGFGADEPLRPSTLEMTRLSRTMLDAGLPWEGLLEGARVYADTLRRLADASLEITHRYLCEPLIRAGQDERALAVQVGPAMELIAPTAEQLLRTLHREYMKQASLAHALTHFERHDPDAPPGSRRATILFVDLALFTTFAELEGDEAAVAVVDRFDRSMRELSVRHDGRLVKQIGDEFMLVFPDPAGAVSFALEIQEAMWRTDRYVALRAGIHHGLVLYRLGDYYGAAVNIASRIASMALPNSILITEPVAKAAADQGIEVEELGVRSLRGMEDPVPLYRVVAGTREG